MNHTIDTFKCHHEGHYRPEVNTMTNYILSPRMRLDEVVTYLNCSKSHVYDLHRRRLLIRRKEGARFTYWIRSEVEAFALGQNPYEGTNETSAS